MVKIHPISEKLIQKNRQARLLMRVPEDQLEEEARIARCQAIARELQNYERELSNIENRIRGIQHRVDSTQANLESYRDDLRNENDPESRHRLEGKINRLRQDIDDFLSQLSEYEREKNGIEETIETLGEEARQDRCNFA